MATNGVRVPCIVNNSHDLAFVSVLDFLVIARDLIKLFVNKCNIVNENRKKYHLGKISVNKFIV